MISGVQILKDGKGIVPGPMAIAPGTRFATCILRALGAGLFLFGTAFGQSSATPSELQLHRSVDRGLKRGQTDVFSVAATTGQLVQLVARKKGLDVVVTIVDPAGKTLVSADSPNSGSGPEAAAWITEGAGIYLVKVAMGPRSSESGRYEIEVTDLREKTGNDQTRIQAQAKLYEAASKERGRPGQPFCSDPRL